MQEDNVRSRNSFEMHKRGEAGSQLVTPSTKDLHSENTANPSTNPALASSNPLNLSLGKEGEAKIEIPDKSGSLGGKNDEWGKEGRKHEDGLSTSDDLGARLTLSVRSKQSQASKKTNKSIKSDIGILSESSEFSLSSMKDPATKASLLEEKFFALVEENDYMAVEELLWKYKHEVKVDARNAFGYSALALSAISGSLEMMDTLLRSGALVVDEPLICIQQNFREGLMLLLDKMASQGLDGANMNLVHYNGGVYPKGANCVKVAAVENNFDMLKLLFSYYRAEQLQIPHVYTPRITQLQNFTIMESSEAILFSMKALSSPAYAIVMASDDPIMMAFKTSEHCQILAEKFPNLKDEFRELSEQQEVFAAEWLGNAADNYEVSVVLALDDDSKTPSGRKSAPDPFARVNYALKHGHKRFVSHPFVQRHVLKHFAQGLPSGWYDRGFAFQTIFISFLFLICPVWAILYWMCPAGPYWQKKVGGFLEIPVLKLVLNWVFYTVVQLTLILNNNYFDMINWYYGDEEEASSMQGKLKHTESNDVYVIPPVDAIKVFLIIWTTGSIVKECKLARYEGWRHYFRSDNFANGCMTVCFTFNSIFTMILWTGEETTASSSDFYMAMSYGRTVTTVFGNLLLLQMLVNWLKLSTVYGKTYYLTVVPMKDIFQFWVLASFFYVAFVVAVNGLLWPTYADLLRLCEEVNQDTGTFLSDDSQVSGELLPLVFDECKSIKDTKISANSRQFRNSISVWGVAFNMVLGLFGLASNSRIVATFGDYATPQETISAFVVAFYVFFMILVRLNVLIALIVAALTKSFKSMNYAYKFERTRIMMPYIDGECRTWMPSPLNMLPTVSYSSSKVKRFFEKRRDVGSTNTIDPVAVKYTKEKERADTMKKQAAEQVVGNITLRMLRVESERARCKPVSVDNLSDMKAALQPVMTNANKRLIGLEVELSEFLSYKYPNLQFIKKHPDVRRK